MRPESSSWWQQALADLVAAEANLSVEQHHVCAFLCQQAAEKALKAMIIEIRRTAPPATHSLPVLGRMVEAPRRLMTDLRRLNLAYTTARYPDAANGVPADMYDAEIAQAHLASARRVVNWVRERLGLLTKESEGE